MADLNANITPESKRVFDFVVGAAIGAAMIAAGVMEAPVKCADVVSAELVARPTITFRAGLFSTTNSGSPYSAAPTWTPAANSMIVALVATMATTPAEPSSVSAHGVALTKDARGTIALSTTHILTVWVGNAGSSPSNVSAAVTVGGTPTGCVVIEFEVTNWQNTGNILDAIASYNTVTATATSGSIPVRLDAVRANLLAYLSFIVHGVNETTTGQGGNWTQNASATGSFNTPPTSASGQFNNTAYGTPATASWTTSSIYAGVVMSILGMGSPVDNPFDTIRVIDTVTAQLYPGPLDLRETVFADDGGQVDLIDQLTRPIKIADQLQLVLFTGLGPGTSVEQIKCADSVSAALAGGVDLTPPTLTDSVKVADVLAVTLDPLLTSLQDSVKVRDIGFIERVIEETVLVADTVTAAFDFNVLLTENVKVADSVTPSLNPLQATPTESIKCADVLSPPQLVSGSDLTPPLLSENVKVADTVTALLNPEQSAPTENVKADDGGQVDLRGLGNPVKCSDSVTATLFSGIDTGLLSENIKCADTVAAAIISSNTLSASLSETINVWDGGYAEMPVEAETLHCQDVITAEFPPPSTSQTENIKADDGGFVELIGLGNPIKVSDSVSAALTSAGALTPPLLTENIKCADSVTVLLNPEQATPTENIKVADQFAASLDELALLTETLKVADTLSVALQLTTTLTENIKVRDIPITDLSILLTENVKVFDQAILGNDIAPSLLVENVKVADALTVFIDPEQAAPTENVKVADQVFVALDVSATLQENVKVAEQLTPTLDPEQTTLTESIKCADQLFASVGQSAALQESVKAADQLTTFIDPEQATPTENVKCADQLAVTIDLVATPAENIKCADAASPALQLVVQVGDEIVHVKDTPITDLSILVTENVKCFDEVFTGFGLATALSENVKISEQTTLTLDPVETTPVESIKVADTAIAQLTVEQVAVNDQIVRVADNVAAQLTVLQASLQEGIKVRDDLTFGRPGVIDIRGSYVTTIDIPGSYVTTISILGEVE